MTTEEAPQIEETHVEITPLEKKIIRQIEYYFGDVNLPRDKFLNEKVKEDDGWVTLECLTTFQRLKQLSTDLDELKNAVKKSKSGLLEVHEEEHKIRRSPDRALPNSDDPAVRKASQEKTLYMKGFPVSHLLDDIQDFFDNQEVQTIYIKLRKDKDMLFKGSIFVELSTIEQAKKIIENKELKCGENQLTALLRDDYFKNKVEERKESDRARKENEESKNSSYKPKIEMKPGCVMHFKEVGDGTTREDLKDIFGAHAAIAWVDFNKGDSEGFVRFDEENTAQKAIDAVKNDEGKVLIKEKESTVRVLEGEEEENFWKTLVEDMQKRANQRNTRSGGRGGGRGRGNRRGGRGGQDRYQGKRRRPWEHDNKKDKSEKEDSKNEHKKFDDEQSEAKKAKPDESSEPKTETKSETSAPQEVKNEA